MIRSGGELSESQPDIVETGNEQMLNELVEQITAANVSLDELSDSPEVSPEEFKVLASASQSILDDLGELTSRTPYLKRRLINYLNYQERMGRKLKKLLTVQPRSRAYLMKSEFQLERVVVQTVSVQLHWMIFLLMKTLMYLLLF